MCMRNNFGDELLGREESCILRYHSPGHSQNRSKETQVEEYGTVLCDLEMEKHRVDN